MEKLIPYVLTAGFGLVVGYLLGYLNHGLAQRRQIDARRRKFRDEIRAIPLRFENIRSMNFTKTYDQSVPVVKEACVRIFEDIKWWKRAGFIKNQDLYCGFKHSDLEVPRPNNPGGLEEYLRVCFKNQKRPGFPGDVVGFADKKAHEHELSY